MKRILFVAALSIAATACSKGSGSGNGGGARSLTFEPKGFVATGPASPSAITERFKNGCTADGSGNSDNQIDPRLKIGQTFTMNAEASDLKGYKSISGKETITSITADTVTSMVRVTAQVNFPLPASFPLTCKKSGPDANGEYSWDCNFPTPAGTLSDMNCEMKNVQPQDNNSKFSEIPGLFNGRVAYWENTSWSGDVNCDGTAMGHGTETINIVYSNQIPGTDISYCGGTTVFIGFQLKLDTGVVIQSSNSSIDGPHAL